MVFLSGTKCGKPTLWAHLVFGEIPIGIIECAVALEWCSIAMPNLQFRKPSCIANNYFIANSTSYLNSPGYWGRFFQSL